MGDEVGVACGTCEGGPIYFEACPDHDWAIASECQNCGERFEIGPCKDCGRTSPYAAPERPSTGGSRA